MRPISEEAEKDPLFVSAIARAFQVLSAFHGASRALTLNEIATRSGVGKSAVQRIVHTLKMQGYIVRNSDDRGYVPGIRVLDHTLDYLRLNPLIAKALPMMMELRRDTGERVDFSLLDGLRLVYAVRLQSRRESYFASLIGNSVPLYCTAGGRAVLSTLPSAEVDDIIARSSLKSFTTKTIIAPEQIRAAVQQAREQGYAIAAEEVMPGELALGVAVVNDTGRPIGALHIGGSLSDWTPDTFAKTFAPLLMATAAMINKT